MASRQVSQLPDNSIVKMTIRIAPEEREKLEALAAQNGRSLNNELRWLIRGSDLAEAA